MWRRTAFISAKTAESWTDRWCCPGLALARRQSGLKGKAGPNGEDGVYTPLEVQDLNLEDTELVALSACDTAAGALLDYSEGVYGLVRAFHTAGARNAC
ncbi:MAG: CHAT domain-containing protein [Candidatus Competibacteraceae bacterium]